MRTSSLRLLVMRLPIDPDLSPDVRPPLPRPRVAAVVALGGAAGGVARAGVGTALDGAGGWPVATFAVNVVGAALLAALLVVLAERLPRARYLRPLLGTGLLGGFTTFSAFSVDTVRLLDDGRAGAAAAYATATVVATLAASLTAVWLTRAAVRLRRGMP